MTKLYYVIIILFIYSLVMRSQQGFAIMNTCSAITTYLQQVMMSSQHPVV